MVPFISLRIHPTGFGIYEKSYTCQSNKLVSDAFDGVAYESFVPMKERPSNSKTAKLRKTEIQFKFELDRRGKTKIDSCPRSTKCQFNSNMQPFFFLGLNFIFRTKHDRNVSTETKQGKFQRVGFSI